MIRIPLKTLTLIGCDSFGRISLLPELGCVECVDPSRCGGVPQLYPLTRVLQMGWEEPADPATALLDVPWMDAPKSVPRETDVQPAPSATPPTRDRARGPRAK